jgi:hypothetical protein
MIVITKLFLLGTAAICVKTKTVVDAKWFREQV